MLDTPIARWIPSTDVLTLNLTWRKLLPSILIGMLNAISASASDPIRNADIITFGTPHSGEAIGGQTPRFDGDLYIEKGLKKFRGYPTASYPMILNHV